MQVKLAYPVTIITYHVSEVNKFMNKSIIQMHTITFKVKSFILPYLTLTHG